MKAVRLSISMITALGLTAVHGQPYCQPYHLVPLGSDLYIDGFALEDIFNGATGGTATPGHADHTYLGAGTITTLQAGGTYEAAIDYPWTPGDTSRFSIWIDIDQNFAYSENELMADSVHPNDAGPAPVMLQFTIPASAPRGYTGLRVMRSIADSIPPEPCGNFMDGETEDYVVVIDDGLPCIPVFGYQSSTGVYPGTLLLGDFVGVLDEQPYWSYLDRMNLCAHVQSGGANALQITPGPSAGTSHAYVFLDWPPNDGLGTWDLVDSLSVTPADSLGIAINLDLTDTLVGYAPLRLVYRASNNAEFCALQPDEAGTTIDLTLAVEHAGWPCLPAQGIGTRTGIAINSLYFNGGLYGAPNGWPYYEAQSSYAHRFDAGQALGMDIASGNSPAQAIVIALDMNNDDLYDPISEVLASYLTSGPNENFYLPFTIPATCPPGQHVLRVRTYDPSSSVSSMCSATEAGETIDILVLVEDPNGPCLPFLNKWTTNGSFIDGVQLNMLTNTGTGGAWGPAYSDHTDLANELLPNVNYSLDITSGEAAGDFFSAWIDYNNDNDFDDADEQLGWIQIAAPYTMGSLSFTVPTTATLGDRRMRVRCGPQATTDACADMPTGETEDYDVYISTELDLAEPTAPGLSLLRNATGAQLLGDPTMIGATYTLTDATGRVLITERITTTRTELPMHAFSRGSYTIQLSNGERRLAERFIW